MRKTNLTYLLVFSLLVAIFGFNCGSSSNYYVSNEEPPKYKLENIQNIYVSPIPLNPDNWKTYGYGTKQEWENTIKEMNKFFTKQMKAHRSGKYKVYVSNLKDVSNRDGVYVKIKIDSINMGSAVEPATSKMNLVFTNMKKKKVVYKANVTFSSSGIGYSAYSAEGRLSELIDSIDDFIISRFK